CIRAREILRCGFFLPGPLFNCNAIDAGTYKFRRDNGTVVPAGLELGCVFIQQVMQGGGRLLRIVDAGCGSKNDYAGVLDAELQRCIGGQQAPHLVNAEADAVIDIDVRTRTAHARRMEVNGVFGLVVVEKIRVEKRLSMMDSREYADRCPPQQRLYPLLARNLAVASAHTRTRQSTVILWHSGFSQHVESYRYVNFYMNRLQRAVTWFSYLEYTLPKGSGTRANCQAASIPKPRVYTCTTPLLQISTACFTD